MAALAKLVGAAAVRSTPGGAAALSHCGDSVRRSSPGASGQHLRHQPSFPWEAKLAELPPLNGRRRRPAPPPPHELHHAGPAPRAPSLPPLPLARCISARRKRKGEGRGKELEKSEPEGGNSGQLLWGRPPTCAPTARRPQNQLRVLL
jgi:hypothetical protein